MFSDLSPRRRRGKNQKKARVTFGVEGLERRALLASFVVTNVADTGAGSLRQAITDANNHVAPNTVTFNIPGTGPYLIAPASPLPTLISAMTIDGRSQPGFTATPLIQIDGANAGTGSDASGLTIKASNCVIQGLVIDNFKQHGIDLESGNNNVIRGNFVGIDVAGAVSKGNGDAGLFIGTASHNTIGGTTSLDRNVISGNSGAGIHFLFQTATANVISGNYIGTDYTGQQSVQNTGNGIDFFAPATFTTVGGTTPGAGNLISGNGGSGISFFGGDSTDNLIQGNFIGTDAAGLAPLANHGKGVDNFGSPRITILNNLVSGNTDVGLNLGSDFLIVQGNKIGTDVNATLPIANQSNGIAMGFGGKTDTIGGTLPGQGNIIAFNKGSGITISGSSLGVKVLGNSIYANTKLGIDLNDDGVTLNTAGSPHAAKPNLLQSFPVLTSVSAGSSPAIVGTLDSAPNTTYRIEFFGNDTPDPSGYGEGRTFLGSTDVTTDASGSASFTYFGTTPIASAAAVSATATDPAGNTSEFSADTIASALTPGFLQFGATTYSVGEAGGSSTITVTRSGGTSGAASVSYASVGGTASAGSDYNLPTGVVSFADGEGGSKTFSVPIIDDSRVEGNETVLLRLSSATGAALGSPSNATLTIVDDDVNGVVISPTSGLVTTEAGGTATFSVHLGAQPAADVTVGLTSSNPHEGTVGTPSLVFSTTNWNVPQTVTVTGVDDKVADGDVPYAIVTSAASSADPNYNGLAVPDVAVTNLDDDVAGINVTPTAGLVTTEAGGTATFSIVLKSQPTASVTIPLSSSNPAQGLPDRSTVVFNAANWNVPQVVTVRGIDDNVVDGDVAYSIVTAAATSLDPKYRGMDAPDVAATNQNTDVAGITVTPTGGLVTTEGGSPVSFIVRITSKPTAPVTIDLASSDPNEAQVNRTTLTFTAANWNVGQIVTITGVSDHVIDGDKSVTIVTAPAASADPVYSGIDPADVSVINKDVDVAGITFSSNGPFVTTEAGGAATFTARLNSRPAGDVTIGFISTDTTEGTVSVPSLTFTPANWDTPQAVTITGVNDNIADGNVLYTIVTSPLVSADPNFNNFKGNDFAVTNVDDDRPELILSTENILFTTEAGGTATIAVRLGSQPLAPVQIPLSSSNPTEGVVRPSSLIFTPANWNVAQTVTIVGVNDDVDDGDVAYQIITGKAVSADPVYSGRDLRDIFAINANDDHAGLVVAPTSALETSAAGGSATLSVRLRSRPTAAVNVDLASSNPSEGTVATPHLVFTPGNWNVPQTVTIVGSSNNTNTGRVAYSVSAAATSGDRKYNAISAPALGLTNLDAALVSVLYARIVTVKVKKSSTQSLVVSLSGDINAATAPNLGNYVLFTPGKVTKKGKKPDVVIPLGSATYDATRHTITIAPRSKTALKAAKGLQFRVIASGLLDTLGRPVDGDRDGRPGGNAVVPVTK